MSRPKIIMITGVTGTLGQVLLEKILKDTEYHVLGISRDEQKQRHLPKHSRARYRLADIRDMDALYRCCDHPVDLILHLAALKCVDTLEENPTEALKTNVLGTLNICDLASNYGARVAFTSTDKAVYPINAYGQSKALAEKIVLMANPQNVVIRYGNVLGSRGSFLPQLVKSLRENRKAFLTHKDMTRFWMHIDSVRDIVFETALNDVITGVSYPTNLKASYVSDLIAAVAKILGIDDYEVESIGMRPGEKYHEALCTEFESGNGLAVYTSDNRLRYTASELENILRPIVEKICASA